MLDRTKPQRSINRKLGQLVLVAVGVALSIVATLGLWRETVSYTQAKREQMLATAQVFGAASARAVAAEDVRSVLLAIRAIGRVPGLAYAQVENRHGAVLADIGSAVRLDGDADITEADPGAPLRLLAAGPCGCPCRWWTGARPWDA
jgi:hypothetical protein